MKFVLLFFLTYALMGCVSNSPKENLPLPAAPPPAPIPTATPNGPAALDWEKDHPERIPWSTGLASLLDASFSSFDKAKDAGFFCAKYKDLSRAQKIFMFETMIVWISYYESAWDPGNASVDVGQVHDQDTWSIGLMQMSVTDQESYGFAFGYKYNDLLDPVKNLRLAVAIMAKQVDQYGKLLIASGEPGLYWATIHPGGKYDVSDAIAKHTQALGFCR